MRVFFLLLLSLRISWLLLMSYKMKQINLLNVPLAECPTTTGKCLLSANFIVLTEINTSFGRAMKKMTSV